MVKYFKIILILLLRHHFLLAQNLVPNSSFEEYKKCPEKEAEFNKNVAKWQSPNKATPDYFNSCSSNKLTNTNTNFAGSQKPHEGNSYIGITSCMPTFENFREYIQCKINEPLKKDQLYCCSFYISLADKSPNYTDRIGMYLSVNKIKTRNKLVINKKPQIENKEGLYLNNKIDWFLVYDTLRAFGGEQYITIGNFYDDKQTILKTVDDIKGFKKKYPKSYGNSGVDGSYYYIDEVSVTGLTNTNDCLCKHKKTDSIYTYEAEILDTIPKVGENFILKNVFFETAQSTLLSSSYTELDKLASHLKNKEIKSITVSGFTDNVGNEKENQKLSEARAKAVMDYLIVKGINKDKINYKGYGSTKPISDNKTEEGRAKNRRVEIIFE